MFFFPLIVNPAMSKIIIICITVLDGRILVFVLSLVIRSLCNVTKQQKAFFFLKQQKYIQQLKPINVGFIKKEQHPLVSKLYDFFMGNVDAALFYTVKVGQEHLCTVVQVLWSYIIVLCLKQNWAIWNVLFGESIAFKISTTGSFCFSWNLCCLMKYDHKRAPLDHCPFYYSLFAAAEWSKRLTLKIVTLDSGNMTDVR